MKTDYDTSGDYVDAMDNFYIATFKRYIMNQPTCPEFLTQFYILEQAGIYLAKDAHVCGDGVFLYNITLPSLVILRIQQWLHTYGEAL